MQTSVLKSVFTQTKLALVRPFGLVLGIGDVISVDKDGGMLRHGHIDEILPGTTVGAGKRGLPTGHVYRSAKGVSVTGGASVETSGLNAMGVDADAGVHVNFANEGAWLMACHRAQLRSLASWSSCWKAAVGAYKKRRSWDPDWAVVETEMTAAAFVFLMARQKNTKLKLHAEFNGKIPKVITVDSLASARLRFSASNTLATHWTSTEPTVVLVRAYRVQKALFGPLKRSPVQMTAPSAGSSPKWKLMEF